LKLQKIGNAAMGNNASIPQTGRFGPVQSAINAAAGVLLIPKTHGAVLSVTYSFIDTASKYNPLVNPIQSRFAVIAGQFGDALSNFTITYDLVGPGYRVLYDQAINDPGPTTLVIPSEAEDAVTIESGEGVTMLLAPPIATGVTGALFVARFHPTSKGLITQTARAHTSNTSPNASAGGSGGTGGGGGGGTTVPSKPGGHPLL
jgi:hypothetical protein